MEGLMATTCLFFIVWTMVSSFTNVVMCFMSASQVEAVKVIGVVLDELNDSMKRINGSIRSFDERFADSIALLSDYTPEFHIYQLKEAFLEKKDTEGVMLLEAVERQLKKRRKAQPKPV